jgi:predicted TIM-barrel fold metal-dependent hydrolase
MKDAAESYLVWPYVDVHAHIHGRRREAGGAAAPAPPGEQSFERYLARMAQTNIVAAIPSPAGPGRRGRRGRHREGIERAGGAEGIEGIWEGVPEVREANDATAAGCRLYPERFPIGLAFLDPRLGRVAVDEIERAMGEAGLVGLMCPPRAGAGFEAGPDNARPGTTGDATAGDALGAVLLPALEVVDARGGLALLHVGHQVGGIAPARVAAGYARRFGRTTFVMATVSPNEPEHRESIDAFAGLENVWCDLAQHPDTPDRAWDLADLVRGLSAGRLLFGSDAPYWDYRPLQDQIEAARIDSPRKDRIAWANAVDLIGHFRPGWTPPRTPPSPPDGPAGVDLWRTGPGKSGRLL